MDAEKKTKPSPKLDYDLLRKMIRKMQRWHKLYKLLHEELLSLGYWKAKPRADPYKGYLAGMGKHKKKVSQ